VGAAGGGRPGAPRAGVPLVRGLGPADGPAPGRVALAAGGIRVLLRPLRDGGRGPARGGRGPAGGAAGGRRARPGAGRAAGGGGGGGPHRPADPCRPRGRRVPGPDRRGATGRPSGTAGGTTRDGRLAGERRRWALKRRARNSSTSPPGWS